MKIKVKLFATFRVGRFSAETREYPAGTLVAEVHHPSPEGPEAATLREVIQITIHGISAGLRNTG